MAILVVDDQLHRAVAGDRAAFEAICRTHYPPILAFLRRMLGREAEDAAQRTFLNAWRAIASFDPARPIRPWLLAIALNETRKDQRDAKWTEPMADVQIDAPLAPELIEREDTRRRVAELVAALPEEQRSMMLLRFQQGLSPAEIAEAEGVSVNAVRIRLTRAVQWLRAKLAEEER
jgi:RNA polymerase sigma-70 factor (ECF subfamily)